MKQWKKIIPFLLSLGLLCAMSMTAFAATELPDLDQRGSLQVTVKMDNKLLPGGKVKVYQIATLTVADGAYSYAYTDGFAGCDVPLSKVQVENLTPEKAVVWSTYATQHNITSTELTVDKAGTASDSGLELGLYLIQQGIAASGYVMSETVVPIPLQEEDGSLNYVVEAMPKVMEPTPSELGNPGSGSGPGDGSGDKPGKGGGSKGGGGSTLPKTGQLWWPVCLLAIGGILLYSFGWNSNRKSE